MDYYDDGSTDICRVCRLDGSPDKPLFHPCVCTGSIRYVHQECLVQWLKYSKKEFCELCKHRYSFTPIYAPDMPKRLPVADILSGLMRSVATAVKFWIHYTVVAFMWLGVVPLMSCRIYRCLFTGSVSSLLTLPLDLLNTENLLPDSCQGFFVVTCTLCAFIGLVWLREQILHGGGPEWLDADAQQEGRHAHAPPAANNAIQNGGGGEGNDAGAVGDAAQPGAGNAGDGVALLQQPGQQQQQGQPLNRHHHHPLDVDMDRVFGGEEDDDDEEEDEDEEEDFEADDEEEENEGEGGDDGAVQEDNGWNPMAVDWGAGVGPNEELTWERLLGLDGSLVFLEHVFWVISINTLFILIFAFCPYHIGHFATVGLQLEKAMASSQFEGLLTTLGGYVIIAAFLVLLYYVFSALQLHRIKRVFGFCYVVVKVSLLVIVEIGISPLICGWWLDICSLSLFDVTLGDRQASFVRAPGTTTFLHWLVGMVYVFYFASFILLLREILRPGVLWFLRNLNDPDFNPIQEMIHLPLLRHFRRFLASMIIFGSTVFLMLWLPVRLIKLVVSDFLPYNVSISSETPVSELSLELLLLQVVLPALLEQGHTRSWLKSAVTVWARVMSSTLGLRSYLMGDVPLVQGEDEIVEGDPGIDEQVPAPQAGDEGEDAAVVPPPLPQQDGPDLAGGGLGAAHQAMLQGGGPTGFMPYKRPTYFILRLLVLLLAMCVTLFVASVAGYLIPVALGRACLNYVMTLYGTNVKIHELYTAACGLYLMWLTLRFATLLYTWVPRGAGVILVRLGDAALFAGKTLLLASIFLILIPLLLGSLFQLVIVIPVRVPLTQTPLFNPWQDWALGILHMKITCALALMGPNWWLKASLERIYQEGLWNLQLSSVLFDLAFPVLGDMGLVISLPYVIAHTFIPWFGLPLETEVLLQRRIYIYGISCLLGSAAVSFQAKQFCRLYEHIKNDKYLVGQRLVNYNAPARAPTPAAAPSQAGNRLAGLALPDVPAQGQQQQHQQPMAGNEEEAQA